MTESEQLKSIGIKPGQKIKDITADILSMNLGSYRLYELIINGNVKIIQTGDFKK